MSKNTQIWGIIVIVVIIVGLLAWWIVAAPQNAASNSDMASSTAATSTTGSVPTTDESSSNVASIVANLSGASQFASLFASTGVAATIGSDPRSQYTIFVPTDGSIGLLPSGTISSMTSAQLLRFVQYHVISGHAIDTSAMNSGSATSLSGDVLNFSDGANNIPMVDSAIIVAEYKADNGVVYLINNALVPPQKAQ